MDDPLSHCLVCSEWISSPCSYCACPFRTAAANKRPHHPESEAGREIGPGEDLTLRAKLTVVGGRAAA